MSRRFHVISPTSNPKRLPLDHRAIPRVKLTQDQIKQIYHLSSGFAECEIVSYVRSYSNPLKRYSLSFARFQLACCKPGFAPTRLIQNFHQTTTIALNKCHTNDWIDCCRQAKHGRRKKRKRFSNSARR